MMRHGFPYVVLLGLLCLGLRPAAAQQTLVIDTAQSAGIDGRAWDKTFPNARTVDAVHRAVLLRFPGATEQIAAQVRQGQRITKVEILFPYEGYEIRPNGYTARDDKAWKANPPQWHLVGWALRRPWATDKDLGPTFNAYLNGAGYWTQYGARDPQRDRFTQQFGPTEVSHKQTEGRMDVTALLSEETYGKTLAERLRSFEAHGLLLQKWELYDARYRDHGWDVYEWNTPTGGNGLTFKAPLLAVSFAPGNTELGELPAPVAIPELAKALQARGGDGKPTAVIPTPEEIAALAARHKLRQPAWMPDWQWQRVQELWALGGGQITVWGNQLESGDPKQYQRVVNDILATPPRYWKGWGIQDDLLLWHQYGEMLPAYTSDHLRLYWTSWLMPEYPTDTLINPISQQVEKELWAKAPRWQGYASFFRNTYTHRMSTMNFNHTACMGALLGGEMIGSGYAIADGRHGLEHLLLRFWSYLDGTSQEMLDHYYFSITLSGQKMFADYGPTHLDRLMGSMIRDRAVELLTSAYHPALRRPVNASGRANLPGVTMRNEGVNYVLHTLSKRGALLDADLPLKATVHGLPLHGGDFPAGRAAMQTMVQPWAPEWVSNVVDAKPLPYEETATETTRGNFKPPLWRRAYLGRYYGLASQDLKGGTVDVLGQWTRKADGAERSIDLGTLTLRYNINTPNMTETHGGGMPYSGGVVTFQDKNRAIVCTKPRTEKDRTLALAGAEGVKRLSSTIALWNFQAQPTWELYVDGRRIEQLPVKLKAGQVITLKDGPSFLGIIPLPATDLGRTDDVVIELGAPGPTGDGGPKLTMTPALLISSYNLQRETPVPVDDPLWERITRASYGGFVIEMGDAAEYRDFAAFQRHLQGAKLTTRWEDDAKTLHVGYQSGKDLLEMGFCTDYAQSEVHYAVMPGQHTKAIPYRRVNGQWPYLPDGLERDTTLTQQGTTGRLEKQGAVLVTKPGQKGYVQTELISGTYTGYNPLPDPTPWAFTVPGGVEVRADGQASLLRVSVRPKDGKLWVDYAVKAGQTGPEMATSLLVFGLKGAPTVEYNGKPLGKLATKQVDGKTAYVIPLATP